MGWLAEFLILVAYLWGVCPALLGGAFGIAYVWERFSPMSEKAGKQIRCPECVGLRPR